MFVISRSASLLSVRSGRKELLAAHCRTAAMAKKKSKSNQSKTVKFITDLVNYLSKRLGPTVQYGLVPAIIVLGLLTTKPTPHLL